jgi:hypothetical protein
MDQKFDPIILRYDGLDADQSTVDLGQIGISLQGASKILGSAGSLVVTGQYARRGPALSVRVLAGTAKAGTWDLPALLISANSHSIVPMLPGVMDQSQKLATKAVTSIFNYVMTKLGGNKSHAEMSFALAEKALTEMGRVSIAAMGAVERIAANQRPAARMFVAPVGESCSTVTVGEQDGGAISVDTAMRAAIDAPASVEIGQTAAFAVLISELDLKNKSCKFSLRDDDDPERRLVGEIVDPVILRADNPYSRALSAQTWLQVSAKPELKDGEIERLYITDTASPLGIAAPL